MNLAAGRRTPSGGRAVFRRHVALIGMMGAGKSTVGRLVAARLGLSFADTDALIEARHRRTVARLFAVAGEPAFRAMEGRILGELAGAPASVIAVGGGLVTVRAHAERLRLMARCVFLDVEPAELAARVRAGGVRPRPLLRGAGGDIEGRLAALLQARRRAYRDIAEVLVRTTGLEPEQAAELVARALAGLT